MDLDKMTAEELLDKLPPDEDDRWEFKSKSFLDPKNKGDLRKELGKQVSAFANSGGGNLVFGVSKTRQIEHCEQQVGRETMKDYLATMVEQCVEQPIRHFRVHRIPLTDDATQSLFVIAIEDSPAAPHQAKDERNYYYRIDGHSKPAPHFHLELLRNRMSRAVLEITNIDYAVKSIDSKQAQLHVALKVSVENKSLQCATAWGIYVKRHDYGMIPRGSYPRDNCGWEAEDRQQDLKTGFCVHIANRVLLPSERSTITVDLVGVLQRGQHLIHACEYLAEVFGFIARPISQNYVGEERLFYWQDHTHWRTAWKRFRTDLEPMLDDPMRTI